VFRATRWPRSGHPSSPCQHHTSVGSALGTSPLAERPHASGHGGNRVVDALSIGGVGSWGVARHREGEVHPNQLVSPWRLREPVDHSHHPVDHSRGRHHRESRAPVEPPTRSAAHCPSTCSREVLAPDAGRQPSCSGGDPEPAGSGGPKPVGRWRRQICGQHVTARCGPTASSAASGATVRARVGSAVRARPPSSA
jgi:hypothetical protein